MRTSDAYAQSLLELSTEQGGEHEVYADALFLHDLFEAHPDYMRLISLPAIPLEERKELLRELLTGAPDLLLKTAFVACDNNMAHLLSPILKSYIGQYQEKYGIVTVTAISAVPLSEELFSKLRRSIKNITKNDVFLKNEVVPSCLGGLRLVIDGRQYDCSVQGQLEEIQKLLENKSQ